MQHLLVSQFKASQPVEIPEGCNNENATFLLKNILDTDTY